MSQADMPNPLEQQDNALRVGFNRQSKRVDRLTTGALVCFGLTAATGSPTFMWAGLACVGAVGVQLLFGIRNISQPITVGQRIEANVKAAYWNCQRALAKCMQGITPK